MLRSREERVRPPVVLGLHLFRALAHTVRWRTERRRGAAYSGFVPPRAIRRKLIGIGIAKDVIVATPEDIERYKDTIGLIYRPALTEGKVIYAA